MFSSNKLTIAAALCFAATTAFAQQLNLDEYAKLSNLKNLSKQNLLKANSLSKNKLSFTNINELQPQAINKMETRAESAPVAFYTEEPGVYHLVPNFYITQEIATSCGFLAPVCNSFSFTHKTLASGGTAQYIDWILEQSTYNNETVQMYSFPATFTGNPTTTTPELTVGNTAGESTYQAGTLTFQMSDGSTQEFPGMISMLGSGWVYNVDVDAWPTQSTSLLVTDTSNPWNSAFFGKDLDNKPMYVELFDEPVGGYAAVEGTYFNVLTPPATDLSQKKFIITYFEFKDTESGVMLNPVKELLVSSENIIKSDSDDSMAEWTLRAIADEPVLIKGPFAVGIMGPQDGTGWALRVEIDRLDKMTTNDVNTTCFIPTIGANANQLLNYTYQDRTGKTSVFPTSMDVANYVNYPYMLIMADGYMLTDSIGLNSQAAVINSQIATWRLIENLQISCDVDWLTFTLSDFSTSEGVFDWVKNLEITAQGLPEDVKGRIAHATFTDKYGYSKTFTFIQGDGTVGVDAISDKGLSASYTGSVFNLTYPVSYKTVNVLTTSGQVVGSYELPESGKTTISANELEKGIYLLQFAGADTKTVKVVK